VTLNNRIYFRDHPSQRGLVNSSFLSSAPRRTGGLPGFARTLSRPSQSGSINSQAPVKLDIILPHPSLEVDHEKGNSTIIANQDTRYVLYGPATLVFSKK
jgi:hypothetical protein